MIDKEERQNSLSVLSKKKAKSVVIERAIYMCFHTAKQVKNKKALI